MIAETSLLPSVVLRTGALYQAPVLVPDRDLRGTPLRRHEWFEAMCPVRFITLTGGRPRRAWVCAWDITEFFDAPPFPYCVDIDLITPLEAHNKGGYDDLPLAPAWADGW